MQDFLEIFVGYVPLLQTIIWAVVVIIIVFLLRKQLQSLLKSITQRLREGSALKVGTVEIGERTFVTETADLREQGKKPKIFGNPDNFQLLFKAQGDTFTKSTKAMQVTDGCVLQVTTERRNPDNSWSVAEALTFVPGVMIVEEFAEDQVSGRYLSTRSHAPETQKA